MSASSRRGWGVSCDDSSEGRGAHEAEDSSRCGSGTFPATAVEFLDAGFAYSLVGDASLETDRESSDGVPEAGAHCSEATVHDLNLRIGRGECVVVTGSSGCGKTTLTRMINGLIPAVYAGDTQGAVSVGGRVVSEWEMDDLSCAVGSVFQNPRSQFFNLDTTSEIAFGCENMGVPREEIRKRIVASVRELSIEGLLDRDIRALSGGEKQLVAVASVHAMRPEIFVFDEPTAALDVGAMLRLREAIAHLKSAGRTVVVAEHRLWWLSGVADRVVLMRDGRIEADLSAEGFSALPAAERAKKGLRAWDVVEIEPPLRRASSRGCDADGPALAVRGLSVRYGRCGTFVVDDCDFDAWAGRAVALVGRNGAGKTTFARCLAGLHREAAGEVKVAGRSLSSRARAGRVYLAMQESGYQLFSDTVEGELRLALAARRRSGLDDASFDGETLIEQKLADFGLSELHGRHPLSLSGGQRQRLALAAGALQGAPVMVLDEPTSGLDLSNMQRVAAEIERLKAEGVCLVIITHDFEFACATCDEVAYLEGGRIAQRFDLSSETVSRARKLFGFRDFAP